MSKDFQCRLAATLSTRSPRRYKLQGERDAAVLIPIVGGTQPSVIFTVRTDTLPSHKGQISFPGGSIDTDDQSAEAAALRETHEELGINPGLIEILGELDSVPTFVSGYVIAPFIGWLEDGPELTVNPREVAAVLEVPVGDLVEDIRVEPGFSHGGRIYPTEAWIWRGHVIWGATARILRLLLIELADAGLGGRPGDTQDWPQPMERS